MKYAFMFMAFGSVLGSIGVPADAQPSERKPVTVVESAPGQVSALQVKESVATVEAIDLASRQVTLRDEKGRQFPLLAGPEVRNLAQVKVGDRVTVKYAEALSLKLVKNGKELPSATEATDSARAPAGARPGGIAAQQVKVTADVIAVDAATGMVTLRGPKQTVDLHVKDPAQLALIKVGDKIDAEYTQALAVTVQPAAPGK